MREWKAASHDPVSLCNDIYKLFVSGSKATERQLFASVHELAVYFVGHQATEEMVVHICDLERKIVAARGPNKQFVEQELFRSLTRILYSYESDQNSTNSLTLAPLSTEDAGIAPADKKVAIALQLLELCRWAFQVKLPRDTFSSKRRGLALELVGSLSGYYEIPELVGMCKDAISSKKADLIAAGIDSYQRYLRARNMKPSPEMLDLLDEVVSKTMEHSVAVSALNIQVETGVFSEFEALSRIGDWKEKNWRRG